MTDFPPTESTDNALIPAPPLTFNFFLALPGRASSRHTQRAYFRWIEQYLADIAGLLPAEGEPRRKRMEHLPVETLRQALSAPQLRAWLGTLVGGGHGKQGVNQARAAIVTLGGLMAEAGWLDDYTSAAMGNVRPPSAQEGQRPGRWLSLDEIRLLMTAARDVATSPTQRMRNNLAITMLCTMALRRDELSSVRWGDLTVQNDRAVLRVRGKGNKSAIIDVPRPVMQALQQWQKAVSPEGRPLPTSPLLRRVWKRGRVSDQGVTPDGIWLIVSDAAKYAGIGHVAPHDLRRSVAGALQESGVAIDKISRLLRHSNVAVTERYLSRLPQRNEGAVLMSDALGLENDDEWPEF